VTTASPAAEVRAAYQANLDRWQRAYDTETARFVRLGLVRGLVFVAAAALAVAIVLRAGGVTPAWLLLPVVAFIGLVVWHERVSRRQAAALRSVNYFLRGLARLDGRWVEGGDDGERFRDDAHPYASDLELFGRGSVFHLVSTCRTNTGALRLAGWLLAPAGVEEIGRRQAAVRELARNLELRHALAVIGPELQAGLDSRVVRDWATAPPVEIPAWYRTGALLVALANVATLMGWGLDWWKGLPFAVTALVGLMVAFSVRSRVVGILAAADAPTRELRLLAVLLERVAEERFSCPWLEELGGRWHRSGASPALEVRRLERLVDLVDARRNQIFMPIAGVVLLGTQLAIAIERWRERTGPAVVDWLDAMGDLEAAVSFATHAAEHPDDAWPVVAQGPPRIVAAGLAHPLLPEATVVRNDLALGDPWRLAVISGSNMSGKSTLLKAVGVNLVLAQAGAPVRATSFALAPAALGASLVLRDSLLEGRSRFFAEIVRLRDIVALTAGERPVVFLLDELLSGTNSHDRAVGAEGVLKGLVDRGALGLVTTHDLALTRIADALGDRAVNWHLEDRFEAGALAFDYRLKPGVVKRSNALELMRSVGLEVRGGDGGRRGETGGDGMRRDETG
jgi:MutS domain V